MVDLLGIEDKHKRAKAILRHLEENKKKTLKMKEAEEKAVQKEMAKLHNSLDKTNKRGKKMMNPPSEPEYKSPPEPSPTYDSRSHAQTQSKGTKRDSSYEQLSQGIHVVTLAEEHDGQVGEWIKNFSLEQVLGGDTSSLSPLYDELKIFISKVFECN